MTILVSEEASMVVLTAAQDFADYLLTSMNVSVSVKKGVSQIEENEIIITTKAETNVDLEEANSYKGFRLDINNGIKICGFDDRGAAQALYFLEDLMSLKNAPYLNKTIYKRKPMFSPQMVHSG